MPSTLSTDSGPGKSTSKWPVHIRLPRTTVGRQRIVGLVLLGGLLALAFGLINPPALDTVRDDVAASVTGAAARSATPADAVSNCFQGACYEDGAGMLRRWWDYSTTYLELIAVGIVLAALAAGVTETLLFPAQRLPAHSKRSTTKRWRFRRITPSLESRSSAASLARQAVAAGALSAPILAMVAVLFSPNLIGLRVGLGFIALILMKWLAPMTKGPTDAEQSGNDVPDEGAGWSAVIRQGLAKTGVAAWRFFRRLVPFFVLVALVGGLGTQHLTEAGVDAVLGNHMLGVVVAAVVGLLVSVPLTIEIPLVAAGLLLGIGWVPAGVLLFVTAASGSVTLRDLARGIRHGGAAIAPLLIILAISLIGGGAGLMAARLAENSTPTIAFDGETCSYTGPAHFNPEVVDFVVRNETEDAGNGHTMALVVGRLPNNVSIDHFAADVHAAPRSPLPGYFTEAGTHDFVSPATEQRAEIGFHRSGTYAVVCLNGGGHYVIFEFSMPQPMGWFDEFQDTFTHYVAPVTFTIAD